MWAYFNFNFYFFFGLEIKSKNGMWAYFNFNFYSFIGVKRKRRSAEKRSNFNKKFYFFSTKVDVRNAEARFLLFFKVKICYKNDFSLSKPVFSHSHGTPKTGFRAPLPPKIFPATVCWTVETRWTPL